MYLSFAVSFQWLTFPNDRISVFIPFSYCSIDMTNNLENIAKGHNADIKIQPISENFEIN